MEPKEGDVVHDVEDIMFDKMKYIKSDSFALPVPELDTDYFEKVNSVHLMDCHSRLGLIIIAYKKEIYILRSEAFTEFFKDPSPDRKKLIKEEKLGGENDKDISLVQISTCGSLLALAFGEFVRVYLLDNLLARKGSPILQVFKFSSDVDHLEWMPRPDDTPETELDYMLILGTNNTLSLECIQEEKVISNPALRVKYASFVDTREMIIAIDVDNNILHLSPKDLKILKTIKPIFLAEEHAVHFDLRNVTRLKQDLWSVAAIFKEEDDPERKPEEYPMFVYYIYGDITAGELNQFKVEFFTDLFLTPDFNDTQYIPPKFKILSIPRRELILLSTSQSQELGVIGRDFTAGATHKNLKIEEHFQALFKKSNPRFPRDPRVRGMVLFQTLLDTEFLEFEQGGNRIRLPFPPSVVVLTSAGDLCRYLYLDIRTRFRDAAESLLVKPQWEFKRSIKRIVKPEAQKPEVKAEVVNKLNELIENEEEKKVDESFVIQGDKSSFQKPLPIVERRSPRQQKREIVVDRIHEFMSEFKKGNQELEVIRDHISLEQEVKNKSIIYVHDQMYSLDSSVRSLNYSTTLLASLVKNQIAKAQAVEEETQTVLKCINRRLLDGEEIENYESAELISEVEGVAKSSEFVSEKLEMLKKVKENLACSNEFFSELAKIPAQSSSEQREPMRSYKPSLLKRELLNPNAKKIAHQQKVVTYVSNDRRRFKIDEVNGYLCQTVASQEVNIENLEERTRALLKPESSKILIKLPENGPKRALGKQSMTTSSRAITFDSDDEDELTTEQRMFKKLLLEGTRERSELIKVGSEYESLKKRRADHKESSLVLSNGARSSGDPKKHQTTLEELLPKLQGIRIEWEKGNQELRSKREATRKNFEEIPLTKSNHFVIKDGKRVEISTPKIDANKSQDYRSQITESIMVTKNDLLGKNTESIMSKTSQNAGKILNAKEEVKENPPKQNQNTAGQSSFNLSSISPQQNAGQISQKNEEKKEEKKEEKHILQNQDNFQIIKMEPKEGDVVHDVEDIMFDKMKYIKSDSFALPVPEPDTDYFEKVNSVHLMGNFNNLLCNSLTSSKDCHSRLGLIIIAYKKEIYILRSEAFTEFFKDPSPDRKKLLKEEKVGGENDKDISLVQISTCGNLLALAFGEVVRVYLLDNLLARKGSPILQVFKFSSDVDHLEWMPRPDDTLETELDYMLILGTNNTLSLECIQEEKVISNPALRVKYASFVDTREMIIAIDVDNNILHLSPKDLKILKTIKPIFLAEEHAVHFDLRNVTRLKQNLWSVAAIFKEEDDPGRKPEEYPMFVYYIYGDITAGELNQFEVKFFTDLFLNPDFDDTQYIPPKFKILSIPRRELILLSTSQSQELAVIGRDFTAGATHKNLKIEEHFQALFKKSNPRFPRDPRVRGMVLFQTLLDTEFLEFEQGGNRIRLPFPPSVVVLTSAGDLCRYLYLDIRTRFRDAAESLLVKPQWEFKRSIKRIVKPEAQKPEVKAEVINKLNQPIENEEEKKEEKKEENKGSGSFKSFLEETSTGQGQNSMVSLQKPANSRNGNPMFSSRLSETQTVVKQPDVQEGPDKISKGSISSDQSKKTPIPKTTSQSNNLASMNNQNVLSSKGPVPETESKGKKLTVEAEESEEDEDENHDDDYDDDDNEEEEVSDDEGGTDNESASGDSRNKPVPDAQRNPTSQNPQERIKIGEPDQNKPQSNSEQGSRLNQQQKNTPSQDAVGNKGLLFTAGGASGGSNIFSNLNLNAQSQTNPQNSLENLAKKSENPEKSLFSGGNDLASSGLFGSRGNMYKKEDEKLSTQLPSLSKIKPNSAAETKPVDNTKITFGSLFAKKEEKKDEESMKKQPSGSGVSDETRQLKEAQEKKSSNATDIIGGQLRISDEANASKTSKTDTTNKPSQSLASNTNEQQNPDEEGQKFSMKSDLFGALGGSAGTQPIPSGNQSISGGIQPNSGGGQSLSGGNKNDALFSSLFKNTQASGPDANQSGSLGLTSNWLSDSNPQQNLSQPFGTLSLNFLKEQNQGGSKEQQNQGGNNDKTNEELFNLPQRKIRKDGDSIPNQNQQPLWAQPGGQGVGGGSTFTAFSSNPYANNQQGGSGSGGFGQTATLGQNRPNISMPQNTNLTGRTFGSGFSQDSELSFSNLSDQQPGGLFPASNNSSGLFSQPRK